MNQSYQFEERQYIGTNKSTLSLRIFLAIFCFVAYNYTDVPEVNGDLLFFLGVAILVISVVLLFVTHIHTRITSENILLNGFWGTTAVTIPLSEISGVEQTAYSTYFINNPVYNFHKDGVIKFYSGGKDAVKLTMKNGSAYLIGTHKPEALLRVIDDHIKGVRP